MYARHNNAVWSALFGIQIFQLVLRFGICTVLAIKLPDIERPVSMSTDVIKAFCGISTIVCWFIWFICVSCVNIQTTKTQCQKCNDIDSISKNSVIIRATNLFSVSTVIIIINMVVATHSFGLKEYYVNMIVFIMIIAIVAIMVYIIQINVIRERKEQIVTADKETESLAISGELEKHDDIPMEDMKTNGVEPGIYTNIDLEYESED
jgi:hypothetical protein